MCLGFDVDSKVKLRCIRIETGLRNPYGVGHLLQGDLKFGSISLKVFNGISSLPQTKFTTNNESYSISYNYSWASSDFF